MLIQRIKDAIEDLLNDETQYPEDDGKVALLSGGFENITGVHRDRERL